MFRELPFAIREHDVVVHGIIERLVFFCQDGRVLSADILDFKSDTLSVGTPLGCRKQSRNISRKWLCIAKPLLVSSDLTSAILPHDFFSYSLGRCNGLRLDCTQSEANKTLSDAMNIVHITQAALDTILALQLMVAWAGEGLSDPKRLDWWRTDLVDELGGGDLFARLLPKTHRWASLEAVRKAAMQVDRAARLGMAKPDQIRTLFFWGFVLDEKLTERLAFHKRSGKAPLDVLPFPVSPDEAFARSELEEALRMPGHEVPYKVVPVGRELTGVVPEASELRAQYLTAALLPLADNYPTPFIRVED